jgi:hypothetical protein
MPSKKRKSPDNKEESKREADRLLLRYERGEEKISEGNLRIRINRLGKGGRWFKFSSKGGQKRILENQSSSSSLSSSSSSSSSSSTEEEDEGTLKEQLSMQKIQDLLRTEEKKPSIKELESKLSTLSLDEGLDEDDKKLISDLAEILGEDVNKLKKELTTPVEVKKVKEVKRAGPQTRSETKRKQEEQQREIERKFGKFKPLEGEELKKFSGEREVKRVGLPTRSETKRKQEEQQREIERKFGKFKPLEGEELKKFRGEREYIPRPRRIIEEELDMKHDTKAEDKPYVNELMYGEVEKIPNIDDLNQNIVGVNEQVARSNIVDNENNSLARGWDYMRENLEEDYNLRKTGFDIEEDEYEPLLIPDVESRNSREVSNTREYLARRYGERKAQERMNLIPELGEASRRLLSDALENKMQELGMNIPRRIQSMANDTLSGLIEDAKIGVSLEDIEGMIGQAGIPVSEIAQQLPSAIAQRLPELKTVGREIVSRIPEGMKNSISSGLGLASDAYGIYNRLPESLKKKIREAGGTARDIAKIAIEREEKKRDGREEKKQEPIRRTGLFGEEDDEDEQPIRRTGLFGEEDDEDDDERGMPEQRRGRPVPEEKDPQELLLEQINNINQKLGDMGGSGRLAYAEERKTKAYRFPKPNENYDAIQLIQNSTTGFLNDLNLYGDTGLDYDPVFDI